MRNDIHWLGDMEFAKARGQLKLQLGDVFNPFRCYGLEPLVDGAIEEVIELAYDFSIRVRGDANHPIRLKQKRNPRR